MKHLRIKNAFLFLFFSFQVTTTLFSQCIKGDCSNGIGYYIYSNKDFYIGFFSNGLREGIGFYYQTETEKSGEVYEAAFWQQGTAINSQALIISRGGTSIGNTDASGKITKGVYIDNSLQVFIVYASGKLPADATDCLYGDCEGGYGIFKFADSKGLDHYYVGNFKNGKFNGKGIEVVLENSSVLIGEFENDGNKEGINYLFDDQTANYYVSSSLKEEFRFDYPEYIRPTASPVTSNVPAQSNTIKSPIPEKKKRGWGSFLNAAGGALLLVGTAVLVNELSDNSSSKTSKTNVGSTANNTISSTPSTPSTPNKTNGSNSCYYCFWFQDKSGVLSISPIYSYQSQVEPGTWVTQTRSVVNRQEQVDFATGVATQGANYGKVETYAERVGYRVCKKDFRIALSARDAKLEQAIDVKELKPERVKECN